MSKNKEYICGGVDVLKKLKPPEFKEREIIKKQLGNFFKEVKNFIVSMETENSGKSIIDTKKILEAAIDKLEKKQFKPRKVSNYEKFLIDVFELMDNIVSGTFIERLEGIKKACENYEAKAKDTDRKNKLKEMVSVIDNVIALIEQKDRIRKFRFFSSKEVSFDDLFPLEDVVTAIFGEDVKTIKADAFKGSKNLIKISFGTPMGSSNKCEPNNASRCKIEVGAFKKCKNLKEIAFFPFDSNDTAAVKAAFNSRMANEIEKMRAVYKQRLEEAEKIEEARHKSSSKNEAEQAEKEEKKPIVFYPIVKLL